MRDFETEYWEAQAHINELETENEALRATIRIDWEVIVDAIDDHDIKQTVIRLWNRAVCLLAKETKP